MANESDNTKKWNAYSVTRIIIIIMKFLSLINHVMISISKYFRAIVGCKSCQQPDDKLYNKMAPKGVIHCFREFWKFEPKLLPTPKHNFNQRLVFDRERSLISFSANYLQLV